MHPVDGSSQLRNNSPLGPESATAGLITSTRRAMDLIWSIEYMFTMHRLILQYTADGWVNLIICRPRHLEKFLLVQVSQWASKPAFRDDAWKKNRKRIGGKDGGRCGYISTDSSHTNQEFFFFPGHTSTSSRRCLVKVKAVCLAHSHHFPLPQLNCRMNTQI